MKDKIAKALGGASWLAIAFGIGFLIDCRMDPTATRSECWLTGGGLIGIGGGYQAGYWTPNPALNTARRRRTEPVESVE